jgi:hypothetical protein
MGKLLTFQVHVYLIENETACQGFAGAPMMTKKKFDNTGTLSVQLRVIL